ncbi:MAG TPA: dihydrodipicolinate synthase family protein [Acidimicrobiia bacterium]|nr:dihydrodipicolinate synthase family protein [Acidimicrobiia bacterium]
MSSSASTFVVSVTPFRADGALDETGLRGHLARQRDAGVGVYLAGSGSGEGYALSKKETRRVLEIGVDELRGRVPVRAMGVEPRTAAEAITRAGVAADAGVDAFQLYSLDQGHGNQPTPDELDRYLRTVLDAVTLPVVLSTHQSVGYLLPVELVSSVLDGGAPVVGVNCSTSEVTYLLRLIEAVDGRADVHVGGPLHALTALGLGGQGFLSSDANLAPRLCAAVVDAAGRSDLGTLHDTYAQLMRLYTVTRELGGITATKAALDLLGLPGGGPPRPPRCPADAGARDAVQRRLIDALRWPEWEGLR